MSKEKTKQDRIERDLIHTGIQTEFGEVLEDPAVKAFGYGTDLDVTYTPGWSELRRQRDTQEQEAAHGQRPLRQVAPLPGNVRLVRRSMVNGSPEMTSTMQHKNSGYRPVTQADVGQPWFTELPGGTTILPDGTIAKGDCMYMYCPPEQAARNAAARAQRTRERIGAPEAKAEGLGMTTERTRGEDIQLGTQISPTAVPRG